MYLNMEPAQPTNDGGNYKVLIIVLLFLLFPF